MKIFLSVVLCASMSVAYGMQKNIKKEVTTITIDGQTRNYFSPQKKYIRDKAWVNFAPENGCNNDTAICVKAGLKEDFFYLTSRIPDNDAYVIITKINGEHIVQNTKCTLALITLFGTNPFSNDRDLGTCYTFGNDKVVYATLCGHLIKNLLPSIRNAEIPYGMDHKLSLNPILGYYQGFFLVPERSNEQSKVSPSSTLSLNGFYTLSRPNLLQQLRQDHKLPENYKPKILKDGSTTDCSSLNYQ